MSEIKYYSEEGLQKLKDELHHLIAFDRPAAAAAIAEARDKGDLSENAEYDAAKEAQGHLEARISKLQDLVANARLLDESKIDTSKSRSIPSFPKAKPASKRAKYQSRLLLLRPSLANVPESRSMLSSRPAPCNSRFSRLSDSD